MQKEVLEAGPDAVGKEYYDKIFELKKKGFSPFHKAVSLVINLASGQSAKAFWKANKCNMG